MLHKGSGPSDFIRTREAATDESLLTALSNAVRRSFLAGHIFMEPAPAAIFSTSAFIFATVKSIAFMASLWNSGLVILDLALWLKRESELVKFLRSCIMKEDMRLNESVSLMSRRASLSLMFFICTAACVATALRRSMSALA